MTTLNQETLKPSTNPLVELYELDTTYCDPLNGAVFRFTPMTEYIGPHTGQPEDFVRWGGIVYTPFPIMSSGWEYTFDGAPPKPKLSISNATKFLQAAVSQMGDLVGAKVTRVRTFMNFLDGQPNADYSQHFPADIFFIDQKTTHNKNMIEWTLISAIERGSVQLPLRQILPENGFDGVAAVRLR